MKSFLLAFVLALGVAAQALAVPLTHQGEWEAGPITPPSETTGGNKPDGYIVGRSVDKGVTWTDIAVKKTVDAPALEKLSWTFDNTASIEICYRVRAFNTVGESGHSNVSCLKTPSPAIPRVVTTVQERLVTVAWSDMQDSGLTLTAKFVLYHQDGTAVKSSATSTTELFFRLGSCKPLSAASSKETPPAAGQCKFMLPVYVPAGTYYVRVHKDASVTAHVAQSDLFNVVSGILVPSVPSGFKVTQ